MVGDRSHEVSPPAAASSLPPGPGADHPPDFPAGLPHLVLLKVKLGDLLLLAQPQPPSSIVQMLLILQEARLETSLQEEGKWPCGWSTLGSVSCSVVSSVTFHFFCPFAACNEHCQGPSPPAVSQDTWRCPMFMVPVMRGIWRHFPGLSLGHVLPSGSQEARGWGCESDKGGSFPVQTNFGGRGDVSGSKGNVQVVLPSDHPRCREVGPQKLELLFSLPGPPLSTASRDLRLVFPCLPLLQREESFLFCQCISKMALNQPLPPQNARGSAFPPMGHEGLSLGCSGRG